MNIGIYIGRFQPFHNGHYQTISIALQRYDKVIIVVGSANRRPTSKNPWSFAQRKAMILACFDDPRLNIISMDDFFDNRQWVSQIKTTIENTYGHCNNYELIGHHKDSSSYYLDLFKPWQVFDVDFLNGISASDIREHIYTNMYNTFISENVPQKIYNLIMQIKNTTYFDNIKDEFNYLSTYNKSWGGSPHPPIFITADNFVYSDGAILLIKRKGYPNKGFYALPGGFVNINESIYSASKRELLEETGFDISQHKPSLDHPIIYDFPTRSTGRRIITHNFIYNIPLLSKLHIQANDDAERAFWMDISKIKKCRGNFADDHYKICCDSLVLLNLIAICN